MTVRVVDLLEIVDIENNQAQRGLVAFGEREFLFQNLHEMALVENLGQAVPNRQASGRRTCSIVRR